MIFDIIGIHSIFYTLGQPEGELVKKVFELILFVLIYYMITSEYTRDKRRELRYLIVAFGALAFEKLVSTVVLTSVVFGRLGMTTYRYYFPVMDHALEVFALILLANAFLFPILVKEFRTLRKNILFQIGFLGVLYVVFQAGLLIEIIHYKHPYAAIINHWAGLLFTLMKIVLLLYAVYVLSARTDRHYRYRYSIIIAFLVYFITPFLRLINIAFYDGVSARLFVAGHPFPLLAVILFTRVIYLKLVDKAFLRHRLKVSEERYRHEKELGKLKDKFVSVVSHELRTPLTSINLYTSLLKDGKLGKVSKKQKQAVSIIKDETSRLTGLVNDILDLSRLETRRLKLRIAEFDLFEFCDSSVYKELAKNKGIKIVNKIPKGFKINVDIDKFKQVLINLISNAIKYTDKGGRITLSAKEENGNNRIDIADTGRGISEEDLKKVFDKFYQAEHYMTRKEGGSGLGLTIANEIVKLHGGEIKVSSRLGKGSVFSVIIPKSL